MKIEAKKNAPAFIPIEVNIGERIYQITMPQWSHDGEIITAEEASKKQDYLESLLAMKFGGLKEIV